MPLVSIIMPAYNAAATIRESIESVVNQTCKQWELIVVNDGSADNTREIVTEIAAGNSQIKVINLGCNGGMANARNVGAKSAKGELLAFLDSDDVWMPTKLEKQVNYHAHHPLCAISHTGYYLLSQGRVSKQPWRRRLATPSWHKRKVLLPRLYWENVLATLTVVMKKEVFDKLGGFDLSLWGTEDQDLWIRVARDGYQFCYIRENLAIYRIGNNNVSSTLGRYKRAKRQVIEKHLSDADSAQTACYRKAYAYYYRHFGAQYFARSEQRLARLYFMKSLSYGCISVVGLTTMLYLFANALKHGSLRLSGD